MNYKIKKSVTKEGILFLIFLTGFLFLILAQNYEAEAVAGQNSKGFYAGKLFVAIPEGAGSRTVEERASYAEKSLFFHKAGLVLMFSYLLYLMARLIPWISGKIKRKHSKTHLSKGGFNMSTWMRQNWFKGGVLLSFLIASLSVAYYFVLFLPNSQKYPSSPASKSPAEIIDLEGKCAAASGNFFKENGFDAKNSAFQNNYHNKLNKCFINIKTAKVDQNGHLNLHRVLYDVYNRKLYAEYSWSPEEGKNSWEVKPSVCSVLDKSCQAIEDYESFVKTYMEE